MLKDYEVFIHVGLHKTATTFLQQKVFPSFKHIRLIANPETQLNYAFNHLIYADDSFYNKDLIIEEILKINEKKILISDETLSGQPLFFLSNNRSTVAKRLLELFPNAKILLFIRGQKEILLSLYSQYLLNRDGRYFLLELYRNPSILNELKIYPYYKKMKSAKFGHYSVHGFAHLDSFKYFECVKLYKNLFKEVNIILYEDFLYNPSEVLLRLESFLGEKIETTEINFGLKLNSGLKPKDFNKILFYNKTKFLFRRNVISNFFYFFYSFFFLEKNEIQLLDKIVEDYYLENNQSLIKHYPDVNIKKYPQHYKF